MNEKSLLESWESFAQQHGLKLTIDEQPNMRGVITEYLLHINTSTLLKARIGKTGSYHQESCKLIISETDHQLKEQTIKVRKLFSFRESTLDKLVRDFLETYESQELEVKKNTLILIFKKTPLSLKELDTTLTIPKQLKKLIASLKQ